MASSSVADYYAGKSIFLTGATGFLGKVMIEKLLRSCPDVNKIYLLMRPKKGQDPSQRLDDIINCRLFDKLHVNSPQCFKKLQVISGDILLEDLGVSIVDWEMLQRECQMVFHCAACVRFELFIRDALNMNTLGTYKVLKLAEGMKKLEAFVHVSTAFSHCELDVLEEKVYPSKHKPQKILEMMEWIDDDTLKTLEGQLIHPQPNTYAYTKSLSEDLVSQFADKFPVVIARPSIVVAAYKEPMPGWVDNLNGPTGLMVGAGTGVIRSMHCNQDYLTEIIPVDMVVNACILLGYITAMEKSKEIKVCNVTQYKDNPISWGDSITIGQRHLPHHPFSMCLWFPGGSFKKYKLQHDLTAFFAHTIPAYLIDFLLILLGKKPFLVKIQKRVSFGLNILQYYTTKQWNFKNEYFRSLKNYISAQDDEVFFTDITVLDWSAFYKQYMIGVREFCLKEDPSTIPKAQRLYKQLYYLDLFVKSVFIIFLFYLCFKIFF